MNAIRSFIACELDPLTKERLSLLVTHLKKSNADVKWIPTENIHFTLKFLGNVERDEIKHISSELNDILRDPSCFNIRLSAIGGFPDLSKPRVIWIGLKEGGDCLISLALAIEERLVRLGFQKENRDFRPHLTLGRVRSLKNIEELQNLIEGLKLGLETPVRMDKIILYQSTLTQKGAVYTPLSTHLLK
ncbi:MAG: RNA 2',3'-cyclic phosphodiesterase [Candidatus Omnitrophota bacterium]